MADPARARHLKEDGNRAFGAKNYVKAEALYSKALIADPSEPALYTNRAMARLHMNLLDGAVADCMACLKLAPDRMKAYFYLSQAYLALGDYEEALRTALEAHKLCVQTEDKNLTTVTTQVLQCKRERWEAGERKRKRETSALENETLAFFEHDREDVLKMVIDDAHKRDVIKEYDEKLRVIRDVFERARNSDQKARSVPDWAIDEISFCVMHDPVMTKSGKSYERAHILEHLRRSQTDPQSREPLQPHELRPNLLLRDACQQFLEENGWAADY
ncbi:U-box domain-containing protein [Lasiosphaeria miniovina]|uniref:U-box domain-containing protein n=1 Tax=Lasiosphaeria miniovina TaxID=1954250 RepID=A0AA40ATB2_9PEZI|nr:U-box domain-containing protein [Lasiosphaeria miniovina]KAK0721587.1 U-box domain-containing protein [Lasiosphaeria miniovina]